MVLVRNLEEKSSSRPVLLIVLLGLILNLSGTWLLPLIDRDEPRFAEASREMLGRNDWVVPTFDGEPRYDKPPLIYWAEMAAYRCLGESRFTARLPSALFGTGTALLIFFWARRRLKPETALAAAVIFSTCLQVLIHSRLAVADMAMIFFVCAALWSGWELTRPGAAGWRWWWIFFTSLALGFLAKGPVAWLPLGGLLLARWMRPDSVNILWPRFVLGLLLTVGLVAVWGIPALERTNGDFLRVGLGYHVLQRSFSVLDGHGAGGSLGWVATSPFFFVLFFVSFCPWAFWVPRALYTWWPRRQADDFGWYLLVQAALVFGVFTIVRTKLPHYTLPAFPCLAIWLAKTREDGLSGSLPVGKLVLFMSTFLLVVSIGGGLVLQPLFVAPVLFQKTRAFLKPETKIAVVDYNEPSLVWEFRQVLTNQVQVLSSADAASFTRQDQPSILIISSGLYQANRERWATNCQIVQVQGINFSRFKKTELTALVHP